MNPMTSEPKILSGSKKLLLTVLILTGLAAFSLLFLLIDNSWLRYADARFPKVGTSFGLANLWGVVSRAPWIFLIIPLVLWRPRLFGFQTGKIRQHWRLILVLLVANCGVIAAYLWLTSSSTPYSGNQWLVTEVVTVPLVEEIFWRGLVFTALLLAFRKLYSENASRAFAIWLSGTVFGLMHANNLNAGVALQFVAIQVLNASLWGVVYSYARAKTESIYPPILLHAAMNLVVILF